MAEITLDGNIIHTSGILPLPGSSVPDFTLVKTDFTETGNSDYKGKKLILNIFPSLDTSVCGASVRRFNQELDNLQDTVVLCVSADLPFAHSRFCETEGLDNVINASVFRNPEFGVDFGVVMTDGALKGLLSRSVIVADSSGKIVYTEQVPEIAQEPDYEKALQAVLKA